MMTLHGRVFRDGSQYVSYCDELRIATAGSTPAEALSRTPAMIRDFLETAEQRGILADMIERIARGLRAERVADLEIATEFTVVDELQTG